MKDEEEKVQLFGDTFLLNAINYVIATVKDHYKIVNYSYKDSDTLDFQVWKKWSEFIAVDEYEEYDETVDVIVTRLEVDEWLEKQSK